MSSSVAAAVAAVGRGEIVIVTDDDDRENEGDLIMAADAMTTETMALFLRLTSGVVCVSLSDERADHLDLPLMVAANRESQGTAFTVSVDAADGISTGIGAHDRAMTLRLLADAGARAADFVRPGHVFPLRAQPGGVLRRNGHTEASHDLARMAGRAEAGVLCEVTSADRTAMALRPELERLATRHGMPLISIADLIAHRLRTESLVRHVSEARLPTKYGEFICQAWESLIDGSECVVLVRGDVTGGPPPLVRVHAECVTGDVFHSARCLCRAQLADALARIDLAGRGVLIYLRGTDRRGGPGGHRLRDYELADVGDHDEVELEFAPGASEYGVGAQILRQLGVNRIHLLSSNPSGYEGLADFDLEVVEQTAPARSSPSTAPRAVHSRTRQPV